VSWLILLAVFLKRLKEVYKTLTTKLTARSVAAVMFQNDAMTVKELESVQLCRTPTGAAETLLNFIFRVKDRNVIDCFMDSLIETNQQHIHSYLLYPGENNSSA
jgi:hypothetical protein